MAGASMGDEGENPIAINVTPLVDIIFCLCVFFMISFKFKQLEGKFDSWLPKNKGSAGSVQVEGILDEVRVAMFWDEVAQKTVRQLRTRRVDDDDELAALIKEAHDDWVKMNKPETPVTIDAEARVPWEAVIRVMNLCKRNKIDKIEFALGAPPPVGAK
ncbi:MAG: biopolymer transporter ExbD [Planctomycetes bacterium]|nr:biopolymer transporter ExbD [Planctomycetota bacterium]